MRRPVSARRQKQGAVLLVGGGAHERVDLLGRVELDLGAFGHGQALDVGHRVVRQLPDLARALEDAVEQDDHLLQAAPRQLALAQLR